MFDKITLIRVLDVIISEYGWTIDYCLKLPHDVLAEFYEAILHRKHTENHMRTRFMAIAVNAGFSGKFDNIDKVFRKDKPKKDEPLDEQAWKSQLKAIWVKLKKDPKEFEEKWARGENISL